MSTVPCADGARTQVHLVGLVVDLLCEHAR